MAPSGNAARFNQSYFNQARFVTGEESQRRPTKMTNLQIDDVLGFGELLRGAANENKALLLAAKNPHDPTKMTTDTTAAGSDLSEAKATAKTAVDEGIRLNGVAEDKKQALYADLSNWCDMMATTLGKQTPEGKRILAIRTNLTGTGPRAPKAQNKPTP